MREPLSRDRALAAAIVLVDAEGLPALTMHRLAAELGVEAMSLYHHLPGKEGLLDGLVETVVGEIDEAVRGLPEGPWRAGLRQRFLAARTVMLRHPWAPGLLGARPTIPPTVYAYYDAIVGTMIDGGVSYRLAHRAIHAFGSMALGFAQEVFAPAAGASGGEIDPATLPNITRMVMSEMHAADDTTLGWCDGQVEFEFTLDLLLDGIEALRLRGWSSVDDPR